jgi:hypothetical protein
MIRQKNYENELLSASGACMSFYRSNRESIQNNQDCQTPQFFRQQILQAAAFQKISLLRKASETKQALNGPSRVRHHIIVWWGLVCIGLLCILILCLWCLEILASDYLMRIAVFKGKVVSLHNCGMSCGVELHNIWY